MTDLDVSPYLAESAAGPSDEELTEMYFENSWFNEGATPREFMSIARAVLARFGTTPLRPDNGEVMELVAKIRHFLAGYRKIRGLDPEYIYSIHTGDAMEAHITVSDLTRSAYLLEQLATLPRPVPVSERPLLRRDPFNDKQGRCWCGTGGVLDKTPGDIPVEYPPSWELREPCEQDDCLLPAHALPLPEVQQ